MRKKRWIRLLLTSEVMSGTFSRASTSRPCSTPMPCVFLMTSRAVRGAGYWPLVALSTASRDFLNTRPRPKGVFSRTQFMAPLGLNRGGLAEWWEAFRARAAASSMRRPGGTQAETRPDLRAFLPSTVEPLRIILSDSWSPTALGRRWVPPKPGMMPSFTSTRPMLVLGLSVAMRWVHARASSRPPPRHTPSMAATEGMESLAILWRMSWPRRPASKASLGSVTPLISSTSAPAMKTSFFLLAMTRPRRRVSLATSSRVRSSSSMTQEESLFTFSPGRSNHRMPIQSGRISRLSAPMATSSPRAWPRPGRRPRRGTPCPSPGPAPPIRGGG